MKKPLLSEMTLREKIGQCILAYHYHINRKYEVDPRILRTQEERKAICEREQYGVLWVQTGHGNRGVDVAEGIVERKDNRDSSDEFREYILNMDSWLKMHALVAGDMESGSPGTEFYDLTSTCTPPTLGATDSEELAYELGVCIGKELRCAGVNWRWAPVVDMPNRFGISSLRVFAPDDADQLIRLANAHIRGVQSQGVASTAKHFPGHDRYEYRDAHFTSASIESTMEEWWAEQGKVFQGVIDGGVYSVMIGHSSFPAADDTMVGDRYIPATISKKIITDLLKGKMGFDGVVITDGIVMGGLYNLMPYEELIVELFNAGNDVILGVQPGTGELVEQAVQDGRIAESRIDDACQRVLDMKEKLGMFEDNYTELGYTAKDVTPKTRELNLEIARKGITLVRDRKQQLPLDKEKIKNVTIICSTHDDVFYEELKHMKESLEKRGANVKMQRRLKNNEELEAISAQSDLILYVGYVGCHKPKGGAGLFGEECKTFLHAFTSGKEKSIGVSMGYPYLHYDYMEGVDTFINAYDMSAEMMEVFVEAIFGEIPLVGKSPVNLIPRRRLW